MSSVAMYARAWKTQLTSPLSATNALFVDSFAGDDVRGLGTQAFPFQTLNKAIVYASANSKNYIVCRGYFSEAVTSGYSRYLVSDSFGDFVWDGQSMYSLANVYLMNQGYPQLSAIIVNAYYMLNTPPNGGVFLNCFFNNGASNYSVLKGIPYSSIINYGDLYYSIMAGDTNTARIDFFNASRPNSSYSGNETRCIYDNCKVYLDKTFSTARIFDTCLFRVNCTFWYANSSGVDTRLDTNAMTAAQKQAAVMDWINNATCYTGFYKITFTNCQWTDNKIFNCPDNDRSGTNWDFSLIYGTKEAQPACYMDGGKHIGPFPPAIQIVPRYTADLTTSAYEIEVKTSDNIVVSNGQLSLGSNFTGAILYSKPMLVPLGTQFNGFNVSLFPDTATSGVFVTGVTDAIDMSEANKITVNAVGIALTAGACYLVRKGSGSSVVYNGTAYADKTVLYADSSTILATSDGVSYLFPMPHPSIWQQVQFKICESAVVPADFKTNDVAYPWYQAEMFSKPADVRSSYSTGLRCLRVGNLNGGAVDVGSDGKPLTSAHPEFYTAINQTRVKFFIRANFVMMKITITRFFS